MTKLSFYLLGKCDQSNPSSISQEQIHQWEKEGLITYLGETKDVRTFIAKHSCVILPSSYKEGVPRILLEAMSMQKPIITTNVSGCKECIQTPTQQHSSFEIGQNGILIPPKNPQSLADAMHYLANLPQEKIQQMGALARNYTIERFEIENTIRFYQSQILQHANKKNKTLVFISNTIFAMLNFRLDVLLALQKDGYEIHIIAPKDSLVPQLQAHNFIFHPIQINPKGLNPFQDFLLCLSIYQILKRIQPSLVFNYTIKPAIYGSFASNLLKLPNIAIITGLGYVFIQGGWKKRCLKFLVSKLYTTAFKKTKEVWFLNQDDRQCFINLKIIPKHKTQLLDSEGINTKHFLPQTQETSEEFSFILISRMLWDKGIGEFIQAIKLLKQSKTDSKHQNNPR